MPEKEPDFAALLQRLHEAGARFVLIGGLAMMSHGSAHVTVDIDVAYARDSENFVALANVIQSIHARLRGLPPDIPFPLDAQTFRNAMNLTLETDFGDLDLLAIPEGLDSYEGLVSRAVEMEVFGVSVHVASVDDLIAMKRAANRPKDQAHLYELLALKELLEEG
ncbi:nucleotidyl transferase AbiEii/AbiGii toxin family protein [Armatimonas rosea]|uniref:Putative nucleotidyltransferase n=1 Tax=Armatimonas rosea TaxID=685828 RepID=A0A7W9SRG9_ARMRO|nr:nucleotidyl transferase AbiEii/AbiGii toxin family protein [Armatimonas rosea]MBB6050844.1 putative nucleotidyltransferase [Armatimonas rosea]